MEMKFRPTTRTAATTRSEFAFYASLERTQRCPPVYRYLRAFIPHAPRDGFATRPESRVSAVTSGPSCFVVLTFGLGFATFWAPRLLLLPCLPSASLPSTTLPTVTSPSVCGFGFLLLGLVDLRLRGVRWCHCQASPSGGLRRRFVAWQPLLRPSHSTVP